MERSINSRDEVILRMLRLFPKHVVKDYFEEEEAEKDALLVEVTKRISDTDAFEFARNNVDFTRQHVYIATHDIKRLGDLPDHILSGNSVRYESEGTIRYSDFYDVTYRVFLQEPYEAVNLVFKCPIRIIFHKNLSTIHFTILEKNIQSYLPGQQVLTTRKSVEESQIISLIVNDIGKHGTLDVCDLNKGIKELWKRDIIDAIEIQYLRTKSTSKEVMHEDYTFKQQYPELYKAAIIAPLMKALFKFIANKGEYCDHFAVEPCLGRVTFPTFAKEKEHNQNVIRKILEFN